MDPDLSSKILLIHLGGLGDVCLSESTFLSLRRHLGKNIHALGYERFLNLFEQYFEKVHRIESMKWLHLFSDSSSDIRYKRIIFIGKDRQGKLRKEWEGLSKERFIFIEMYPEGGSSVERGAFSVEKESVDDSLSAIRYPLNAEGPHVEDYQLAQLKQYGIEAAKKEIEAKPRSRIILYPEKGFSKRKWPLERFIELYWELRSKGHRVEMLQPLGLELDVEEKFFFEELSQVRDYFQEGGIFVSNDSGMAHLAGQSGLLTITIFADFGPSVWHPRGRNISLKSTKDRIDVSAIEALVLDALDAKGKTGQA